ncbi:MAG: 3-phosphoserine/phosphohydroxythreonine transaminase [Eubacteriales bacterium]|nr:3-phosphoserine/phosphohydroxythreonine transaminase [Eubacteriales bacterium]
MGRVRNFSAGPACLPEMAMREAADEMLDYRGLGLSVMEMSHRSKAFGEIMESTEEGFRRLAGIPDEYAVLFLQGGASLQFAMAPMNLARNGKADYLLTGVWAQKAADEAARYLDVREAATGEAEGFTRIPDLSGLSFRADADYVHLCLNNTIYGTRCTDLPDTGDIPLVADLSSCILSEPLDAARYGLIYAGAQKNMGIAGLTVVIIRKDLIREDLPEWVPLMLRYQTHFKAASLYNTPPGYAIYVLGKVIRWLEGLGGLDAMAEINQQKAALLYGYLDQSRLFRGVAHRDSRSLMNVTFTTGDAAADADFVKQAQEAGLIGLKGHRLAGGMRASLYNAMPPEGVNELVEQMAAFEKERIG